MARGQLLPQENLRTPLAMHGTMHSQLAPANSLQQKLSASSAKVSPELSQSVLRTLPKPSQNSPRILAETPRILAETPQKRIGLMREPIHFFARANWESVPFFPNSNWEWAPFFPSSDWERPHFFARSHWEWAPFFRGFSLGMGSIPDRIHFRGKYAFWRISFIFAIVFRTPGFFAGF